MLPVSSSSVVPRDCTFFHEWRGPGESCFTSWHPTFHKFAFQLCLFVVYVLFFESSPKNDERTPDGQARWCESWTPAIFCLEVQKGVDGTNLKQHPGTLMTHDVSQEMYSSAEGLLNQAKWIWSKDGMYSMIIHKNWACDCQVDLEEAYEDDWTVCNQESVVNGGVLFYNVVLNIVLCCISPHFSWFAASLHSTLIFWGAGRLNATFLPPKRRRSAFCGGHGMISDSRGSILCRPQSSWFDHILFIHIYI